MDHPVVVHGLLEPAHDLPARHPIEEVVNVRPCHPARCRGPRSTPRWHPSRPAPSDRRNSTASTPRSIFGSSTASSARSTTRSASDGTPSRRTPPDFFGISTRARRHRSPLPFGQRDHEMSDSACRIRLRIVQPPRPDGHLPTRHPELAATYQADFVTCCETIR